MKCSTGTSGMIIYSKIRQKKANSIFNFLHTKVDFYLFINVFVSLLLLLFLLLVVVVVVVAADAAAVVVGVVVFLR